MVYVRWFRLVIEIPSAWTGRGDLFYEITLFPAVGLFTDLSGIFSLYSLGKSSIIHLYYFLVHSVKSIMPDAQHLALLIGPTLSLLTRITYISSIQIASRILNILD